jgi:predicted RNase H-like HicB family nuclease
MSSDVKPYLISHYGMQIQWSVQRACYEVLLPEFSSSVPQPCAMGRSLSEAARNGEQVLTILIEHFQELGIPLPSPQQIA